MRIWNPYLPNKPIALLRGHTKPLVYVAVASEDNRLFSISDDKCIRVRLLLCHNVVVINTNIYKHSTLISFLRYYVRMC